MTPEARVRALARECGFDLVRITDAEPLAEARDRFVQWVDEGRHGDMRWIDKERARRSADPRAVRPSARSVICVAASYWSGRGVVPPGHGRVARYAWGSDYHSDMRDKLASLVAALTVELGGEHAYFVDTGPLMDKALAARSGLGWYGKHTTLITGQFGSYVFLGEVLTTLALKPDPPLDNNCGSCRLCRSACPTGALDVDYVIDSRRCISYLTIEHRGPIPIELRPLMGDWVYGCDVCQEVCPPGMAPYLTTPATRREWTNAVRAVVRGDRAGISPPSQADQQMHDGRQPDSAMPQHRHQFIDLRALLAMTHERYVDEFRGTAIRRAKVWMLRRNAAVALGNVGTQEDVPALVRALLTDEHPVVRSHAAWALGRIGARGGAGALQCLVEGAASEQNEDVRREIELALAQLSST